MVSLRPSYAGKVPPNQIPFSTGSMMNLPKPHDQHPQALPAARPPQQVPAQVPVPPTHPVPPPGGSAGKGTTSLVLAIIAPVTLVLTAPLAMTAALLTYPDEGPSERFWVAPLVLWSIPMLLGLLSVTLAVAAIRASPGVPDWSGSRTSAVAALWVTGILFTIGLILTLRSQGLLPFV